MAGLQRSTEYGGVGQSGYTAGRNERDPVLDQIIQVHNVGLPRGQPEEQFQDENATDDRWAGRGGTSMP
jgi:hypothetical protein